ncbi:tetratricopeptide repeat protein [Tunicatimonas pelagia]|uniref:tetratricopeptide repeat protein n=1 Tax=Tunicatimonas pelagia TaxID=931531 RepID=UPI0026660604|nr:tetratricopeptide repeat protein [Tunicatimonas pelagia]WKN46344.1 tetratricopeptide repeat protein [Tunicatimonas pelagia]
MACQSDPENWYQKEFTDDEKLQLSKQLAFMVGSGYYYNQGTVPDQFLIDEALKYNAENAVAWRERGIPYLKRGFPYEMHTYYQKVIEYDPVQWQGWRGYLYLYFYRDYERAIADFNATDTLTPDFTDYPQAQSVDYMRGLCYYGLEDYSMALQFFTRYVDEVTQEKDESFVDTYAFLYRGLTHEKLNQPDDALADFDRALKYYPQLSDCYYHKSRIHYQRGENAQALQLVQEAEKYFQQGYFHLRPYVEVQEQIYQYDIDQLIRKIDSRIFFTDR